MSPDPSTSDQAFMQRALALAEASVGLASPNPQVGCLLVRDGQILGEGAHLYDRFDHAEIVALKQARAAGHDPRGATAYVTLEPCSHHGRTGPCADALIAARITRCVVATADPNPAVSGRGIVRLRDAGIEITLGLCEDEARALNNAFAFSITHHRPFVTLKSALSVDGFLAPAPALRTQSKPFFLTGIEAREEVQQLRHASDAILTGIGTVLADDPLLTDRTGLPRRRPLLRIVLDSALRTPLTSKLLHPVADDLWIFCDESASPERECQLAAAGARITRITSDESALNLDEILTHLHQHNVLSILLEAGSALNAAFLRQQLVDRAILYYAETELGPGSVPFTHDFSSSFAFEQSIKQLHKQAVGKDVRVSGLLHNPWKDLPLPT